MEEKSVESLDKVRANTAEHFVNQMSCNDDIEMQKYKLAAAYRMMVMENLDEGGISGHISLKVPGYSDRFWVNPFGLLSEEVTPDNLVMVDIEGNILEGNHPINVAGFCIHAAIHRMYPDKECVAHTHSPWGTLFSATGQKIKPIDQNCCMFYDNHVVYDEYNGPVIDADDAQEIGKRLNGMDAIILKNHGTITTGSCVESAVVRMVAIERAYRLNVLSNQLPEVELIDETIAEFTKEWIGNDIGLAIEFRALLRKVERTYPIDFKGTQTPVTK